MEQSDIHQKVQANVELTYRIRNLLLRGRLLEFGQALDEAWQIKRQLSPKISNAWLDGIYSKAREHGATGGKLLGAGGGGCFVFFVPPFRRHELVAGLESAGLRVQPFRFEHEGLRAWSVRERSKAAQAGR